MTQSRRAIQDCIEACKTTLSTDNEAEIGILLKGVDFHITITGGNQFLRLLEPIEKAIWPKAKEGLVQGLVVSPRLVKCR